MAARWWHSRYGGSFLRELVLVVVLLLLYKYGRFLTKGHVETALHNARDVISLERSLGVFSEARLQDLVLRDTDADPLPQRVLPRRARRGDRGGVPLALRAAPADLPSLPQRDGRDHALGHGRAPRAPAGAAPHVPEPRLRRHRAGVRTRVVRRGQPVQGLRQPVRGDAVAALRVGARDRVGGDRSRRRASGGSRCWPTR